MSTSQTVNGYQHYLPSKSDAEFGGVLASLAAALAYKQTAFLVFCGASGLAAATTKYLIPGYAALSSNAVTLRAPFTGKLAAVYARARTAPDAAVLLDVLKNGSGMTGQFVLSSGSTTATPGAIITANFSAGDTLSVSAAPHGLYSSGGADLFLTLALVAA